MCLHCRCQKSCALPVASVEADRDRVAWGGMSPPSCAPLCSVVATGMMVRAVCLVVWRCGVARWKNNGWRELFVNASALSNGQRHVLGRMMRDAQLGFSVTRIF